MGDWAPLERTGGVLQDSWVPTGQIPPTPVLIKAGIWKQQQQQQHSEAAEGADPWEAGWSSEEWSGSQVDSPGWAALGPFPFPSHLTSSGLDLTL